MSKEKVKKSIFKRWWFWVIVIIVVIIIGVNLGGGSDDKSTSASTTTKSSDNSKSKDVPKKETKKPTKKSNEKVIGIGDPAKIADVTFTVNKVETSTELKSDNEFVDPAKASGKFVILHVTIKNEKKKAISIDSSFFKIMTNDGTTYDPSDDGDVLMVIPEKQQLFLEQINPGITKTGTIVFDVAKDLDLSKAHVEAQTGFWGTEKVKINLK
ncbi:hypothetical protein GCM10011391_28490 [Pullulanibacillus camelliae]|uniref:DUF4352 domain-containing protein n=1 Tax=Pullulanibacillus camelliae TaxID=1707096 RepID=A0A8J3DZ48_9BACL|nr:DUF4352 domain-containing protein [Pullulanibacillus camelliae]GGE48002.1 hypothetical protein GCM10011391_28490 [Pullulanibacillus camelliae]